MTRQESSNPSGAGVKRPPQPDVQRIRLAAVRLSSVDLRHTDFLDDAERRLAWTFASQVQRERFLAGRIALRSHAAEAAGVDVQDLQADYVCLECSRDDHVHGMPRYQAGPRKVTVLASLSRAEDWCLVAASTDGQVLGVGVDLESGVAAGFEGFGQVALSVREREELQKVEPALQPGFQTRPVDAQGGSTEGLRQGAGRPRPGSRGRCRFRSPAARPCGRNGWPSSLGGRCCGSGFSGAAAFIHCSSGTCREAS